MSLDIENSIRFLKIFSAVDESVLVMIYQSFVKALDLVSINFFKINQYQKKGVNAGI